VSSTCRVYNQCWNYKNANGGAQKLISSSLSRHLSTRNISSKSMYAFLSNLFNRQTDRQKHKRGQTHLPPPLSQVKSGSRGHAQEGANTCHPRSTYWYQLWSMQPKEHRTIMANGRADWTMEPRNHGKTQTCRTLKQYRLSFVTGKGGKNYSCAQATMSHTERAKHRHWVTFYDHEDSGPPLQRSAIANRRHNVKIWPQKCKINGINVLTGTHPSFRPYPTYGGPLQWQSIVPDPVSTTGRPLDRKLHVDFILAAPCSKLRLTIANVEWSNFGEDGAVYCFFVWLVCWSTADEICMRSLRLNS